MIFVVLSSYHLTIFFGEIRFIALACLLKTNWLLKICSLRPASLVFSSTALFLEVSALNFSSPKKAGLVQVYL